MGSVLDSEKVERLKDACKFYCDDKYSMNNLLSSIQNFINDNFKALARNNYSGEKVCPAKSTLERFMGERDGGIKKSNANSLEQLLDLYLQQYKSDLTGTFTPNTIELIARTAGFLCSKCRKPTYYRDRSRPSAYENISEVLPINIFEIKRTTSISFAMEVRGFTDESNGVWLCGGCMAKIKNDRDKNGRYGPNELANMKRIHETFIEEAARSSKDLVLDFAPGFTNTASDIKLMHEVMNFITQQRWLLLSFQFLPGNALLLAKDVRLFLEHKSESLSEDSQSRIILHTIDRMIALFENALFAGASRIERQYNFQAMRQMIGLYLAIIRKIYHIPIPPTAKKLLPPSK